MGADALEVFDTIIPPAWKIDFAGFAIVLRYGGWFTGAKQVLVRGVDEWRREALAGVYGVGAGQRVLVGQRQGQRAGRRAGQGHGRRHGRRQGRQANRTLVGGEPDPIVPRSRSTEDVALAAADHAALAAADHAAQRTPVFFCDRAEATLQNAVLAAPPSHPWIFRAFARMKEMVLKRRYPRDAFIGPILLGEAARLNGCCASFAPDSLDLKKWPRPLVGYFVNHAEASFRGQANGFVVVAPVVAPTSERKPSLVAATTPRPRDRAWTESIAAGLLAVYKWDLSNHVRDFLLQKLEEEKKRSPPEGDGGGPPGADPNSGFRDSSYYDEFTTRTAYYTEKFVKWRRELDERYGNGRYPDFVWGMLASPGSSSVFRGEGMSVLVSGGGKGGEAGAEERTPATGGGAEGGGSTTAPVGGSVQDAEKIDGGSGGSGGAKNRPFLDAAYLPNEQWYPLAIKRYGASWEPRHRELQKAFSKPRVLQTCRKSGALEEGYSPSIVHLDDVAKKNLWHSSVVVVAPGDPDHYDDGVGRGPPPSTGKSDDLVESTWRAVRYLAAMRHCDTLCGRLRAGGRGPAEPWAEREAKDLIVSNRVSSVPSSVDRTILKNKRGSDKSCTSVQLLDEGFNVLAQGPVVLELGGLQRSPGGPRPGAFPPATPETQKIFAKLQPSPAADVRLAVSPDGSVLQMTSMCYFEHWLDSGRRWQRCGYTGSFHNETVQLVIGVAGAATVSGRASADKISLALRSATPPNASQVNSPTGSYMKNLGVFFEDNRVRLLDFGDVFVHNGRKAVTAVRRERLLGRKRAEFFRMVSKQLQSSYIKSVLNESDTGIVCLQGVQVVFMYTCQHCPNCSVSVR